MPCILRSSERRAFSRVGTSLRLRIEGFVALVAGELPVNKGDGDVGVVGRVVSNVTVAARSAAVVALVVLAILCLVIFVHKMNLVLVVVLSITVPVVLVAIRLILVAISGLVLVVRSAIVTAIITAGHGICRTCPL